MHASVLTLPWPAVATPRRSREQAEMERATARPARGLLEFARPPGAPAHVPGADTLCVHHSG
jgi:hypothetical protein